MDFSYSDKNFTVVGNLCFVHIFDKTLGKKSVAIPPAIADRALIDDMLVSYITYEDAFQQGARLYANVNISKSAIEYTSTHTYSYVYFYFPIDSNK